MAAALGASTRAWISSDAAVARASGTVLHRQQQARILGFPSSVGKGRIDSRGVAPGVSQLRLAVAAAAPQSGSGVTVRVAQRTEPELYDGIANFYDESSGVWEDIWGEHMHHGYYDDEVVAAAAAAADAPNHRRAQIKMIEKSLAYAGVPDSKEARPKTIVDVGCGIGGSSRHLARKYQAKVNSITLSPVQVARAVDITAKQGLSELVNFQVANALKQPFKDSSFDLVWSMESGEHMPDKKQFMEELARVAAPGGRIILVTWCHRDLKLGEKSLKPEEQELLKKICDAYYLPAWCSPSDYITLAKDLGLQDIKNEDWSKYVTPFWPAVMKSALSVQGLMGLAKSGWTTVKGALAMTLMIQGYQRGLIKFAAITARKPE